MGVTFRSASYLPLCAASLLIGAMLSGCGPWQPPLNANDDAAHAGRHALADRSARYRVLYSFPNDGGWVPESSLTYYRGRFYGTTYRGGAYNEGTLFAFASSGTLRILHSFESDSGAYPAAGVTELDGTLYGTTQYGGTACHGASHCGSGIVYRISPSGSKYAIVHAFTGGADGGNPSAGNLSVRKGTLYGTTLTGGEGCPASSGCGTVYAVTPADTFATVYKFNGADGDYPIGVIPFRGLLYGTTLSGGTNPCPYAIECGTIFSLTTSGDLHTLFDFSGAYGYWPQAGLTVLNGRLYGTTSRGGVLGPCIYFSSRGCGTVFEIGLSGKYRVVYRFKGENGDGAIPWSPLVAINDTLYGTTSQGPTANRHYAGGAGTLFSVTPARNETVLHVFRGPPHDGEDPTAGLTNVNGTLYGTTEEGGSAKRGTLFSLTP